MQMADEQGANPADDIVTTLIEADVDGQKLSDDEFGFFVILLAVAGNETTRNSITQGMMAFIDLPDQWELYKKERPDHRRRRDRPLGHARSRRSSAPPWTTPNWRACRSRRANAWCCSTARPISTRRCSTTRTRFDILRDPNPHVGFGGTGAHYCIGANLARMTIDLMFNAIADHMPDLTPARRARAVAVGLAQRHQALAGRLPRRQRV